ncbi:cytidyltransferase [Alkalilimnicola ehrlichii]|uniref:Cytidyltransferase n=1 Tax=Alkalilimnicola ehrlichii TaxID=351052 RepID=A0A3E0WII1_9GAMM|nr:AAA family ATPase [Alkalilimnicola ehrlichii]RFA29409.1 cytidyltransferase [Alkalilimnicola ehrlichii]RFA31927.1 cytidyltransferase [Alkalilimnicola ehrlichii]
MKRGLTLGKYAPFHRGHQFVIDTALAEVDELTVIIYDSPEATSVPLSVRSAWIRELYPTVRVVEAWDGPTEVGYTSALMEAHERYVIDTLGIRDITHFYCSEPYGEHMSRALGAFDRRVDPGRQRYPVSGSQVRCDPYAWRDYINPRVYRDLVANIVFLGAPSTGKTTLASYLAQRLNTQWMPEYGREYWEAHQISRRLEPWQLVAIAEGHLLREEARLREANRYLFTDTNALTTETFARYYHGHVDPRLTALADRAAMRYDLVFVCDTDIPYEDSWDRSGEVQRLSFQRQVIGDLRRRNIPFVLLQGSIEQRAERVLNLLDGFDKYANLLDNLKAAADE